ncbi:hypothetical protein D3C75_1015350 [compost metagenome]
MRNRLQHHSTSSPILSAALYQQSGRTSYSCYAADLCLCSLRVFCGSRTWSFERQIWPSSIAFSMPFGFRNRVLRFWHRRSSMGTVCRTHNRRYNRREHKHDLRIFCRHHSSRAENQILWMGECGCGRRHHHWPDSRRITRQVWLFCTHVFWSNNNFIECCLWILFYA